MSFYQQIAPYYHLVFKTNAAQVNFVTSEIPNSNSNIIDVGCGIGSLCFELSKHYKKILGIDLDAEMIRVALNDKKNIAPSIQFKKMSMLDLNKSIKEKSIDGVICFGNTLVHLNSLNEIADFLKQAQAILKPNGKLLIQIVNYDKILSKKIKSLPLINNDQILFERYYNYRKFENKIDFNTKLTIKSTQKVIENSIELLPIQKKDLSQMFNNLGFNNCDFYGSFKQEPFSIDSPALIVAAS